jgi:signal transduction histidine kinase
MNRQEEFMNETFHMLAQPVMALRAAMELGLAEEMNEATARQLLADCLRLIDRLTQDLAVFRELASLDEQPPLQSSDGQALLQTAVEEIAPVAEASGIALHFSSQSSLIECNGPMFQRALFLLFDEMIAHAPDREISILMSPCNAGFRLELCPGIPPGQRRKLCHKLVQFAGGSDIRFASDRTSITFRKSCCLHIPAIPSPDEQIRTCTNLLSRMGQ